jgi:hypothetical protein
MAEKYARGPERARLVSITRRQSEREQAKRLPGRPHAVRSARSAAKPIELLNEIPSRDVLGVVETFSIPHLALGQAVEGATADAAGREIGEPVSFLSDGHPHRASQGLKSLASQSSTGGDSHLSLGISIEPALPLVLE